MVIQKKRVPGLREQSLARFALRVRKAVGLTGLVDILLTNGAELRQLNRRFRQKDQPTDVLSFPSAGPDSAVAGDLAVAVDIAAANAKRLGHSTSDEIKILVLHGVLHLAGFDHEQDRGDMAREEARLRKLFRLPVGLIERTSAKPTVPQPRAAGRRIA